MSTNEATSTREAFEGFALLELMGHRRIAGFVREATIAGGSFIRVDVYPGQAALPTATQYYAPGAVYAITPITEDLARAFSEREKPAPVTEWDLPRRQLAAGAVDADVDVEDGELRCDHGIREGEYCPKCEALEP